MDISEPVLEFIQRQLSIQIKHIVPVSGGNINQCYRLQTSNAKYFIKLNSRSRYPGMFYAEAAGLNLIGQSNSVAVPGVVLKSEIEDESFLILEWVDAIQPTPKTSARLGSDLAQLHRYTADDFGLDAGNYMGSLPQSNQKHGTWADFFIKERLKPMVKIAVDKRLLTSADVTDFDALYKKLPGLFIEESPSLIHGDLWGGNYLIAG